MKTEEFCETRYVLHGFPSREFVARRCVELRRKHGVQRVKAFKMYCLWLGIWPISWRRPDGSRAMKPEKRANTMQRLDFSPGGFALHKVRTSLNHRTHCSAWYDRHGVLIDAELILADGTSRPVRRDAGIWAELQQIGKAQQ